MNLLQNEELWLQMKQVSLALKPSRGSLCMGVHELEHRGRSLEFAEYREYRPGEDLRDLDWKVLARTNRYYMKQRDSHTPARVLILMDDSPSMLMVSVSAQMSKLRAALLLVFGLGYILHRQGDPFSFHPLSSNSDVPRMRSSKKSFRHMLVQLDSLEGNVENSIQEKLNEWPAVRTQSVDHLFVISDFMIPWTQLKNWLDDFHTWAMEVTCFRILDPLETGDGPSPENLLDLENRRITRKLSGEEWEGYLHNMRSHQTLLEQACVFRRIHLHTLRTQTPVSYGIRRLLMGKGTKSVRYNGKTG